VSKFFTVLKFIYLYIAYWLVGLTEEDFYIKKGDYFADLGLYHSAIKYYQKAIKESEMYFLYALIGWCYLNIENDELALDNYRKAYEKIKKQYVTVPLASLEMKIGNKEHCEEVFKNIREERSELPEESLEHYDKVKAYLDKNNILN